MKKIAYILLVILLCSCSSNKNMEKEKININTWSIIDTKTDEQSLEEVKVLLENKPLSSEKDPEKEKTETWILNEKELNIIENTSSWEIDNLIDILFQDTN